MIKSEVLSKLRKDELDVLDKMLLSVTAEQRDVFRRMYNPKGKHDRDVEGIRPMDLDWAFRQVELTLKENAKETQ